MKTYKQLGVLPMIEARLMESTSTNETKGTSYVSHYLSVGYQGPLGWVQISTLSVTPGELAYYLSKLKGN